VDNALHRLDRGVSDPAPKKLVLAYVDSLRTDMLERAVADERAPTFAALLQRGVFVPDCVSSFPSVTPVACAEMVTGVGSNRHWISGMNWYHRLERRYVEYGSSLEATRAFGVFRALYDLVYNMNLAHLSPEVETLFETLDDAGERTACTPFLIYRGRHRHRVSLEGLMKRAVDAGRLKFRHHTWGPAELFYGELYASREVPCKATSIPGNRDGYSACCAADLARSDGYDFLLLSLPDNDNYSHRHGPEASVESIAKADDCFAKLVEAAGGLDAFLDANALILLGDHAQTPVEQRLPLAEILGREWDVLQPSEDRPGEAQLAVSPSGRAAHVYLLAGEGERADPLAVGGRLADTEGVELLCWLEGEDGLPLERREPGVPKEIEATAVVERGGKRLRFRPTPVQRKDRALHGKRVAPMVEDLRGGGWEVEGELGVLEATIERRRLRSEEFPDPLARVWSALTAPHAGDFIASLALGYEAVDWGGVTHVPGGSHGSLHRGDSLVPLLFVGCGPPSAAERDQWTLRDVAPAVLTHFGLSA
jgi:Type I phosphodiesterase / nucleotide pyrophosphatase